MGVTLQATMNTTNGPKIETATLSSTLGGGVVIKDNLGGYFIDSILVVGISGSESSNSTSQSKISITQTEPGSSSTQSIAQSDLSHDGSSYSVNIMQFGDIVGSVLGMFSGSSGGKSVTKISSAGNSKSNTGTYWQSRAATLKSNQNVSLTGTITELGGGQLQPEGSTTGQPSNSGGASASSNGFVLWTASVSDSISGTITNGSFQPITVTIDDIVETGFIRSESTQDLRLSESVSLGSLAEPKSSSSFTIDGLTESLTVTVSAVLPPTNGGGGEPPVGGGGVGTNTGGGVGSSSWRSSHAEISTSESSLSLSESKRGLSNSRSLTDDRTENRIVSHLIWDHNQSDRTSQRVGWGSTLEFTAGHGNHGEPYVSLLKTEFVIEQVETAHYVLKESAPSYDILGDLQMTDWVNTVTHLVQTRGSGNALRFTDRTRITISTHNEGSVTYLYSGNFSTPEGNGSFTDSTIANKQVTVSESHELLTSGPYGFEPTRVVVTDRTENKTYLKSDVSEFSEGWNSVLESSFMTDRYDTKDVDSNSNSTKTKTTRKDRSPVTNSRSYAYVQEDETRSKTTVNTPDEGEAWTEKDTSEDHRTYVNRVRNNSAKGYEHEHGKAYSSHLWFSSPNGGPQSHHTSYSIRTDWPTGGVTVDDGEENGDDGSYDPNSLKQSQDDEGSGSTSGNEKSELVGTDFWTETTNFAKGVISGFFYDGLKGDFDTIVAAATVDINKMVISASLTAGSLYGRWTSTSTEEKIAGGMVGAFAAKDLAVIARKIAMGYGLTASEQVKLIEIAGVANEIANLLKKEFGDLATSEGGGRVVGLLAYEYLLNAGFAALTAATVGAASPALSAKLALTLSKLRKLGPFGETVAKAIDEGELGTKLANLFAPISGLPVLNAGCFAAGTPVCIARVPQDSLLAVGATAHGLSRSIADSIHVQVPIESVVVGARVECKNPKPWEFDDTFEQPSEFDWSYIRLVVERTDGAVVDIELIRPNLWISSADLRIGEFIHLSVSDLALTGRAFISAIERCPQISQSEGSVVTGRFVTRKTTQIVNLTVRGIDGDREVIQGTPIHPIWSIDRNDWVPLGKLRIGETLQGHDGNTYVESVELANFNAPVYNLEIHGEHVYEVGTLGVLVHNNCLEEAIRRGMSILRGPSAPDEMVAVMERLGRPISRSKIGDIIHKVKADPTIGLGAADDVVFDFSGGMWHGVNGEYLGKMWDWL